MILIDDRAGSIDLLTKLPIGIPRQLQRMDAGDVVFLGNDAKDHPVWIGIEYKRLSDALDCIRTGRFTGHQLLELHERFDQVWLLLEGEFRCGADGSIEVPRRGGWEPYAPGGTSPRPYRELIKWCITLETRAGVKVMRTQDIKESASWIGCLYNWWREGEAAHKSHTVFYNEPPPPFVKPTRKARVAKELAAGLGWDKAKQVSNHFRSIKAMVNATEKEWREISGIGKVLSREVVKNVEEES